MKTPSPQDEKGDGGHSLAALDIDAQVKTRFGDEQRKLVDQIEQLKAEKADLHDRLLRRQADFENFRKRAERDRSEFVQFAGMEFVREMLPILDDFERALKVECADASYTKGIQLIYTRLYEALKKMGLEPMDTVGKKFDPNQHQAIERAETDQAEDQTILGEFQKGYNFKNKLLRPAMVKVAVRPS
ncbi:MAG TPA: nucleotide exchange factor GrpE [Bryobacteraceae bacterium]|nr:nucleotide exchange factor GrpE [Bryobacteraceae bacterium]